MKKPPIESESLPHPLLIMQQIKQSESEAQRAFDELQTLLNNSFMDIGISEISKETVTVLNAGKIDGNLFFLPQTQLGRKLYEEVNQVLENIGGKWNRKLKAHEFVSDPTLKIQAAIETGKTVDDKKRLQFFETPEELVDRLIELADIRYVDVNDDTDVELLQDVLEPSAGHGAIADKIDGSRCLFRCTEIDPEKVKVLFEKGYPVFEGDFLTQKDEEFDRIIMNPPFTKQQDIDHVLHAYGMLRPGGRVVSVMAPGFTFRTNKKSLEFKALVDEHGFYEDVPEGAFKKSGTNIKTVVVVLNKPIINSNPPTPKGE